MEKPDSNIEPTNHIVFLDTSLDTHFALTITSNDTVSILKEKIMTEHLICFANLGKIDIQAVKVERKKCMYQLSDSVVVRNVFGGFSGTWLLSVDAVSEVVPGDDPLHMEPGSCSQPNLLVDGPSPSAQDLLNKEEIVPKKVLVEKPLGDEKGNKTKKKSALKRKSTKNSDGSSLGDGKDDSTTDVVPVLVDGRSAEDLLNKEEKSLKSKQSGSKNYEAPPKEQKVVISKELKTSTGENKKQKNPPRKVKKSRTEKATSDNGSCKNVPEDAKAGGIATDSLSQVPMNNKLLQMPSDILAHNLEKNHVEDPKSSAVEGNGVNFI
ncbi:hypothetical protein MKW94_013238 [Papaver nudicaule]|uniref:Uncharacterized protein n=1 Tax=Papaver nudicaule TaxID=74823 RepID=A0AA41VVB8_PAPNU|nr:hypothetical protein [Papaver nudicaule]